MSSRFARNIQNNILKSFLNTPMRDRTYKMSLEAVSCDGRLLRKVRMAHLDDTLCNTAFSNCQESVLYIPEWLLTENMKKTKDELYSESDIVEKEVFLL
jgi:hypothetical protein